MNNMIDAPMLPTKQFESEMSAVTLTTERQTTHGDFKQNAQVAQEIKNAMRAVEGWELLTDVRKEALEFIASKIGRILSGKSDFKDHWDDIQGYAELAKK